MRLWLVRHAPPLIAPGLCYGRTDVPADAELTAQVAEAFAQAMKAQGAIAFALRSSPLRRAHALAEALSAAFGLEVQADPRLAEMNFGQWEGVAWASVPKAALDAWTAEFASYAFGGCESTQQVLERVWQALQEARQRGDNQIWVTHAGVIRAVTYLLGRGEPRIESAQDWPREAPGWGQWLAVDV